MQRIMLRSKIHRARVTDANLHYTGSIAIDPVFLKKVDLLPYEKVQVLNINNGSRAETYVIEGKEGTGEIVINGALARWAQPDDVVIIIAYGMVNETELADFKPRVIVLNENNEIVDEH